MTVSVVESAREDGATQAKEPFLNRRRLRYGLWSALALWITWMLSVALGPGHLDLAGQRVGNDLSHFYAAGLTVRDGEGARLYDIGYQFALQASAEVIGSTETGYSAFLTPPFHALTYVPLTYLPYEAAFVVLSLLGLIALVASLRLVGADIRQMLPWAASFFPVFATISFGQNAFLSLVILAGTYALWRSRRLFLAGLVLSLILYKPQLAVGVSALWALQWRRDWRALAGLATGGATFAAISFVGMAEASRAYLTFSREILPKLATWSEPSVWHMHTPRNFFEILIGSGPVADGLALVIAAVALAGFIRFRRIFAGNPAMTFAGAIVLTLLVTPHALVYDWVILLVPAVLLWNERAADRALLTQAYAAIWIVIWFAGPLTSAQLYFSDRAFQASIPVLLVVVYKLWRRMIGASAPQITAPIVSEPAV
jgi:alpha-1,2-mannosyltransferase